MCRPVSCSKCGKTTWAGCGKHVEAVKASVPPARWCLCPRDAAATSPRCVQSTLTPSRSNTAKPKSIGDIVADGDLHLKLGRHAQALTAYFAIHDPSCTDATRAAVHLSNLAEAHLGLGEGPAALAAAAAALVVSNFGSHVAGLQYAKALHLCGGGATAATAACPEALRKTLQDFTAATPRCDQPVVVGGYPHAAANNTATPAKGPAVGNTNTGKKDFTASIAFNRRACRALFKPLGQLLSNASLAFTGLRQWRNAAALAATAPFFCAELAEENEWRYATAMAHLGTHLGAAVSGQWPAEVRAELALIEKEGQRGDYDYAAMWAETAVPTAEYASDSVAVRESPGKGRGLFAIRDIPAGTLLMCSHNLARIPAGREDQAMYDEVQATSTLPFSGGQLRGIYELDDDETPLHASDWGVAAALEAQQPLLPCRPVAYDAPRVVRAAHTNGIVCEYSPTSEFECGVWLLPSMLNHEPVCNTSRLFFGQFIFIRTRIALKAGEEITCSYCSTENYVDEDQPLAVRGITSDRGDLRALAKLRAMNQGSYTTLPQFNQWKADSAPLLPLVDSAAAVEYKIGIVLRGLEWRHIAPADGLRQLLAFGSAVDCPCMCAVALNSSLTWDDPLVVELRRLVAVRYGDSSATTMKCLIDGPRQPQPAEGKKKKKKKRTPPAQANDDVMGYGASPKQKGASKKKESFASGAHDGDDDDVMAALMADQGAATKKKGASKNKSNFAFGSGDCVMAALQADQGGAPKKKGTPKNKGSFGFGADDDVMAALMADRGDGIDEDRRRNVFSNHSGTKKTTMRKKRSRGTEEGDIN